MKNPIELEAPGGAKDVLLHTCCAPCSSAIIECMIANGIRPVIFFFNPNIYPLAEYEKRKQECIRYSELLGLEVIDTDYDHACWMQSMRGMEHEPERGKRCLACFSLRLAQAAKETQARGLTVFTTTLASSRWKDLDQIFAAGRLAAKTYPETSFWEQNWRKGGLSERRSELVRQYDFYNQPYCGCEFSKQNR